MKKIKEEDHAKESAKATLDSIKEMVDDLRKANDEGGTIEQLEEVRERIQEDPLEVSVRSDWHSPGSEEDAKPSEFLILLATGGPEVRIIGELDEHFEPTRARIQYQDWGTPWTELFHDDHETVLEYCRQFYFGG